jgi:hypothetical protein
LHSNVRGAAGSQFVSQTPEALPEPPANRPVPPVKVTVSSPSRVVRANDAEKGTNSRSPFAATRVAVPLIADRFATSSMTTLSTLACPVQRSR